MNPYSIQELPQLLTDYFGKEPKITREVISDLKGSGIHFGSQMLKVDLEIEDENRTTKSVHAVGKRMPQDPFIRKVFNCQLTFKKEIAFYSTVVPTMKKFQKKQGVIDVIDCFPEFYGGRLALAANGEKPDEENAIILLENLKETGYVHMDPFYGFDVDSAKVVLRDLARFHGIPLAIKLKDYNLFEKNIKTFFHDYQPDVPMMKLFTEVNADILKEDPECAKLIPKITFWGTKHFTPPREPFASISHGDLWLSNAMQKYEGTKVVKNKFVDFQFYTYRSVAADVLFFIWTSVREEVLNEHFEELLRYYHQQLLRTLEECNCPTDAFGYQQFFTELKIEADYVFGHALQFVTFIINLNEDHEGFGKPPNKEAIAKAVTKRGKERAFSLVKECHRLGWL